jgi:hypothetical protein
MMVTCRPAGSTYEQVTAWPPTPLFSCLIATFPYSFGTMIHKIK